MSRGWKGDSARHSLAARGCSTRHPVPKSAPLKTTKTITLYRGIGQSELRDIQKNGCAKAGSYWAGSIDIATYYAQGHVQDSDVWGIVSVTIPTKDISKMFSFESRSLPYGIEGKTYSTDMPKVLIMTAKSRLCDVKIEQEGRFR